MSAASRPFWPFTAPAFFTFPYHQRHGRKGVASFIALALVLWPYATAAGELGVDWSMFIMLALMTGWQLFILWMAWKGGSMDEEDAE